MDWGLAKVLAEGGIADEERASRERERPEDATTIRTARSTGSTGSVGTDTEAGSLLGTPAYMPPEQANGDVANLDRRADVFGLGAILCEILTGQPPYVGRSAEEVRRKACNGDLADATARLGACGADAELIALSRTCLASEAIDRPKDAQAVTNGLAAYLNGVQERLHQAELAEAEAKAKAIEEAKRRRLTLALAATVLLALTLCGGGWLWVKADRDAQAAQVAHEVNDALNQATALRAKAKAATVGSAALFAQAREQAQRALALVENGSAEAALTGQVQRLKAELDEEEKNRVLMTALDEARLAQAESLSTNRFALERAVPKLREAFAAYGLAAGQGEPTAVAEGIRGRPPAVQEAILAALDEWDDLAGNPSYQIREPHREWLRAVLEAVEPENTWGRKVRAARREPDALKRQAALEALAASADVDQVPLRALTRLAYRAKYAGGNALRPTVAVKLLRRVQARYPADFWVNENLGMLLQEVRPPQRGEAVRFLTAAAALRPESPGACLNLAAALANKGQVDEAIACFKKAIALDPKYAAAHFGLGNALLDKGQVDEAIACFKKAIALDPKDAEAHNNLGNALGDRGQVNEAIASFKKAIAFNPKLARPHNNLGNALRDKGQVDDAIACFKKAIALDPKYAVAHTNLGIALRDKGKVDEAIASFKNAIEADPKLAQAHGNLGNALKDKGQVDEAIACHRKVIALDPKNATAHNNLGLALKDKGQVDEAIACCQKAIELDPKHAEYHYNLGVALHGKGRVDEAIVCWRKVIALKPKHAAAHNYLGVALFGKGRVDEAIVCWRKVIALNPKDADAHNNLGASLAGKGKVDEAIACWRKVIELDPKFAMAHYNLGKALKNKGRVDEAIAAYKKAIELDPKYAKSHYDLGVIRCDVKRDYDGAIACFRTAIELDPKDARAHQSLGLALQRRGRVDEAIACYQRVIELDPKNARGPYDLGNALADKGQLDQAIASYQKAIASDPNYAEAHCNLAAALQRQGRFAEALAAFRRGHDVGTKQRGWRYPSAQWVRQAERMAALERKLLAFLKGELKPRDTPERLGLIAVCQAKKLHHTATRLYADAFAADTKLADDRRGPSHRYNAACHAALAAAGQAEDAARLDDAAKAKLRGQAHDWLKAELTTWSKLLDSGPPQARAAITQVLSYWRNDPDLAGIRDQDALVKLPTEERTAFAKLWADVTMLLKKAER
jgi:superkiller protein 3